MATFTPPTVDIVPPFLPDSTRLQKALWKFYPVQPAFVIVFLLSDGTYRQNYATLENQNTNIPYPWNPYVQSAPYVINSFYNYQTNQPETETVSQDPYILKIYDRPMYVTPEEVTSLTANNYGGNIT